MTKAFDFEAEVTSRGEELKALAIAKKIIKETTNGAAGKSYGFFQMSSSNSDGVRFVRQLASRMAYEVRFCFGSQVDIFGKIKGVITDMIEKLEAEAYSW